MKVPGRGECELLNSLKLIYEITKGNESILRKNKWLQYLYLTKEQIVNLEQVDALEKIPKNPILPYVEKTLRVLNEIDLPAYEKEIIEEVLIWSEVAKGGLTHKRKEWQEKGFQLSIHNIGSAQIYAAEQMNIPYQNRTIEREELIYLLILTHGLVGQFIRGEVRYQQFSPLIDWIEHNENSALCNIERVLLKLNQCIIEAVSKELWASIYSEVEEVISLIIMKKRHAEQSFNDRLKRLRESSIKNGEDFNALFDRLLTGDNEYTITLANFFKKTDLWYVESALQDFTFEEFLKIFLFINQRIDPLSLQQVSFEPLMRDIYYDYKGKKAINLYKKRIIESYLAEFSLEEIAKGKAPENEHVTLSVLPLDQLGQIVGVQFTYSKAGQKLIEFCQEAEKSPLYERAIIMLYDFFGFRKDAFDRLQNEQTYLTDMNNGQDQKKVISDYATGDLMLDIGAGGGVMLDLLTEHHPDATVVGIDVSTNVIEELNRKKIRENKRWLVKQADALDLKKYYEANSIDTIVFSSILHELYSYIPYNGRKFNHEVVLQALKSSFEVLSTGGRIIIRDGIMTEPKDEMRLLEFKEPSGMDFFKRYVNDFKGRKIEYKEVDKRTIQLPVNDLMEFCYTYTWGEEAYPHEVQEQFGYFTPTEYKQAITQALGKNASIIKFEHYLQKGYEEFLLPKVKIMNKAGDIVRLPDSTCFIVIEKIRD